MWIGSGQMCLKQENDLNTYYTRAFYALRAHSSFLVKAKTETGMKGRTSSLKHFCQEREQIFTSSCSYSGRSEPIPPLSGLFSLKYTSSRISYESNQPFALDVCIYLCKLSQRSEGGKKEVGWGPPSFVLIIDHRLLQNVEDKSLRT